MEITLRLTDVEAEALGRDAEQIAELLDTVIWALGMLRTGINSRDPGAPPPKRGDWDVVLRHFSMQDLPARFEGTRRAVIRAYADAGGTTARLARTLRVTEAEASRLQGRDYDWSVWASGHAR